MKKPSNETPLGAAEPDAAELLRQAFAPDALDPETHEAILAAALSARSPSAFERQEPAASEEELLQAALLREALEGYAPSELLALAEALRQAHSPSPLPEFTERRLLRDVDATLRRRRIGLVISVAFGAASLAAAAFLVFNPAGRVEEPWRTQSSTAPLFHDPFSTEQATLRMEAIFEQRSRDLRENRYLAWGVR